MAQRIARVLSPVEVHIVAEMRDDLPFDPQFRLRLTFPFGAKSGDIISGLHYLIDHARPHGLLGCGRRSELKHLEAESS